MIEIKIDGTNIIAKDELGKELSIKMDGSNFDESILLNFLWTQIDKKRSVKIITDNRSQDEIYRMQLIKYLIESFLLGYYGETNIEKLDEIAFCENINDINQESSNNIMNSKKNLKSHEKTHSY